MRWWAYLTNDGVSVGTLHLPPPTPPAPPGLIVLPGLLTPAAQRYLVRRCLTAYALAPNRTNLDAHYRLPVGGVWRWHQDAVLGGRGHEHGRAQLVRSRADGETASSAGKLALDGNVDSSD